MARVTVEDCVVKIPNRFDLVMLAAQRARDIASGAPLTIDRDNDKNPVVSLREIADETISLENLAEALVQGMQKHVEVDEPEPEAVPLLAADTRMPVIESNDPTSDTAIDRMTEEELLRGLESLTPPSTSNAGSRARSR